MSNSCYKGIKIVTRLAREPPGNKSNKVIKKQESGTMDNIQHQKVPTSCKKLDLKSSHVKLSFRIFFLSPMYHNCFF